MKNKSTQLFILIILVAQAYRLPGLSFRTMHGDEAVNALKFSQLLEKGQYNYNPNDYHGPALYYLTLPVAYLASQYTLQDLSEITLRIVPLLFCMGLLLLLLLIRNRVGDIAFLFSSLLLAVSPVFVYYSRYYIHEMLFVFFCYATIFSLLKLYEKRNVIWSVFCGLSLAMMMATKETWLIILCAAILSLVLMIFIYSEFRKRLFSILSGIPITIYVISILTFIFVYMLMLTSFLQDFTGLQDSIAAIQVNWDKSGEHSVHAHPWYQYVKWLAFSSAGTYFYSESLIAILAITGIFYSFKRTYDTSDKSLFFMKFMSLFAIISTFIFSVILYKTPWNALSFWLAMVILAGFGLHSVLQDIHNKKYRNILIIIVLITVVQLGWQSYQVNFIDYENPANPYVYAHPQKDIFRILDPLNKIASKHADKNDLYIQVIVKDNDYWPLPWYLRHFTKVGWWNRVDMDVTSADFIIISPEMEGDLVYKFYEETEPGKRNLYVPLLPDNITLRSGTQLKVFVTLKIRDLLNDD